MSSNELLLLVDVPENYRLGGPAFQKLYQTHPRVHVKIVRDLTVFAEQVMEADAVTGSRPYLRFPPEVLRPEGRLHWVQTTMADVDYVLNPELIAADPIMIT